MKEKTTAGNVQKNDRNQATEVSVVNKTETGISIVDLNGQLPDLTTADTFPFDLMADYWTPETPGESKRVFFDKIDTRKVLDQETQEAIDLECAFFIEVTDGNARTISNGSKRLVGALEAYGIQKGTPLLITYMGKKKNRTNSRQSDNWSIKPLKINI
ncbi:MULTISPECIES: hypothetical protein [Olivibacter]|uniref:ParB/Sulfiredoxin domain-containing protein n=1 Tax=Olivibacter jilunii TaxID=985016 RepID=A0ABW6AX03_9SPHI